MPFALSKTQQLQATQAMSVQGKRSVAAGATLSAAKATATATATAIAIAIAASTTTVTATGTGASEVVAVAGRLARRWKTRRRVAGRLLVVKIAAWLAAVAVLGFHARVEAGLGVALRFTRRAGELRVARLSALWVACILAGLSGVGCARATAEVAAAAIPTVAAIRATTGRAPAASTACIGAIPVTTTRTTAVTT